MQTYLTSTFSENLSEKLNTTISIQKVDISWFLNVVLEDVYAEDQKGNKLLDVAKLEVDVNYLKIFDHQLSIQNIALLEPHIAYRKYKGEEHSNIQFLIDYFSSPPSDDTTSVKWDIDMLGIDLTNAHIVYDMEDQPKITDGFDHNHIQLSALNLQLRNLMIKGDTISMRINHLGANDISGLKIEKLNCDFEIRKGAIELAALQLNTEYSKINGELKFLFDDWAAWSNFLQEVKLNTKLDSSHVSIQDIAYFAPTLKGMNEVFLLNGEIKGSIDRIKGKNLLVGLDAENWFEGNIKIHGLPHIEESFILVNAKDLRVNPKTIANIRLPKGKKLIIPEEVKRLKQIYAKGRFTGFLNDFVANASFKTALGGMTTDLSLKPSNISNRLTYEGKITSTKFDLGKLLATNRVGKLTFDGNIKGAGMDKNADAKMNFSFASLEINGGTYKDIDAQATIKDQFVEFSFLSMDDRFELAADGNFSFKDSLPIINLHSEISNARLGRFLLNNQDTLGEVSTQLNAHIVGDALENLSGNIQLDSISYIYKGQTFFIENLDLKTGVANHFRELDLKSDYLDTKISGIKNVNELEYNISQITKHLLPSLLKDTLKTEKKYKVTTTDNIIDIDLHLKEAGLINELFLTGMQLSSGTKIKANYNAQADLLKGIVNSPQFDFQQYTFKGIHVDIKKDSTGTTSQLRVKNVLMNDSSKIDSVYLISKIIDNAIVYKLTAGKKHNHILKTDIGGKLIIEGKDKLNMQFQDASFWLANNYFQIENGNKIWVSKSEIRASNFKLFSDSSSITANGRVNKLRNDKLTLKFDNFDLNTLDPYTKDIYSDFDGIVEGTLVLSSIHEYLDFLSKIHIKDFAFNNSYIGNTKLNTTWDKDKNAASLNLSIFNSRVNSQPLTVHGFYYPQSKTENFDLDVNLYNFPAKAIESYLSSFSSKLEGDLSGNIHIGGKTASPEFEGKVKMDITAFKVDYLNTTYAFKDEMIFDATSLGFKNVKFFDEYYKKGDKNSALADFKLSHKSFKEMAIDLTVSPEEMFLLNTTNKDNEMFYGKAYGTGNVRISGPLTALDFRVNVQTSSGTVVSIPITYSYQAEKADFITFINPNQEDLDQREIKKPEESGSEYTYNMDLNFGLRPSATIRIVMDETTGDVMEANGSGDIRLTIDPDEHVEMFGEYLISKGKYEVYGKDFSIEKGGKIVWDGDIEEAKLNIRAVHSLKTQLKDLLPDIDSTLTKVNCIISITGDLYSPEIKFDIELPDLESTLQEQVNNILSIGGEKSQDILNRNFVYLMILGKFQPSGMAQIGDGSNSSQFLGAGGLNAADLLFSQISNQANKIFDELNMEDLNIGIELNTDEQQEQQIAVALSYSFLDDKIIINSKFGKGASSQAADESSKIIGDVELEYKLTEEGNLRIKAYNKTNYGDLATHKSDYTQGVGITWRRDFDKFSFKRKKKKKKKKQKSEENSKEIDPAKTQPENKVKQIVK